MITLENGEVTVDGVDVETVNVKGKQVAGRMMLTNRRLVLVAQPTSIGALAALFGIAGIVLGMTRKESVAFTIAREDFAEAEIIDARTLVVRSSGEGYGRITFTVFALDAKVWSKRLHEWAERPEIEAPAPDPAPLPRARVVKRDD